MLTTLPVQQRHRPHGILSISLGALFLPAGIPGPVILGPGGRGIGIGIGTGTGTTCGPP
jgi:hypothetical protein